MASKSSNASYERHNQALMNSFQTFIATVPRHALTSSRKRCRNIVNHKMFSIIKHLNVIKLGYSSREINIYVWVCICKGT